MDVQDIEKLFSAPNVRHPVLLRAPKGHINIRILQHITCGIPLCRAFQPTSEILVGRIRAISIIYIYSNMYIYIYDSNTDIHIYVCMYVMTMWFPGSLCVCGLLSPYLARPPPAAGLPRALASSWPGSFLKG